MALTTERDWNINAHSKGSFVILKGRNAHVYKRKIQVCIDNIILWIRLSVKGGGNKRDGQREKLIDLHLLLNDTAGYKRKKKKWTRVPFYKENQPTSTRERERRNSIFHSLMPWLLPSGRFRSLGASFTAHSFARIYLLSTAFSYFFPFSLLLFFKYKFNPKVSKSRYPSLCDPRDSAHAATSKMHYFISSAFIHRSFTTLLLLLLDRCPLWSRLLNVVRRRKITFFFFFCSWCLCCWHQDSIVNPRCSFFTCQILPYRFITANSFIIWNACRTGIQREYGIKSPLTQENFNKKCSLIHGWYILSIVSSLSRHTFVVQHRVCVVPTPIFNCFIEPRLYD